MRHSAILLWALAAQLMLFTSAAQSTMVTFSNIEFDYTAFATARTANSSDTDGVFFTNPVATSIPFSLSAQGSGASASFEGLINLGMNDEFSIDATIATSTQNQPNAQATIGLETLLLVDFMVESPRDEQVVVTYNYVSETVNGLDSVSGAFQLLPRSWIFGAGNNLVTENFDPNISGDSRNFVLDTNTVYGLVMNWTIFSGVRSGETSPENTGFRFGHGISVAQVPEPSSLALLFLSFALVALRRRAC